MLNNYPDVLSTQDVCAILSIGKNQCYELIRSGQIRHIRIGRVYKIPKRFLIEFLELAA